MNILYYVFFFLMGLGENFISSLNSKFRQRSNKLLSWLTAKVSLIVWYFVLQKFIQGELILPVFISYMEGYCLGDVFAIQFDAYLDKIVKSKKIRLRWKKQWKKIRRKK